MVTARSVVIDLSEGPRLVRHLNVIAGITGVAPIVGPLMGYEALTGRRPFVAETPMAARTGPMAFMAGW